MSNQPNQSVIDFFQHMLTSVKPTLTDPKVIGVNDAMLAGVTQWREKYQPYLSDIASQCIATYIDTELDFVTQTNRGVGRVNDATPRFAAKHRSEFSRLQLADIASIRKYMFLQIGLGYHFIEFVVNMFCEKPFPRSDKSARDPEKLFTNTAIFTYSPNCTVVDNAFKGAIEPQVYDNIKDNWMYVVHAVYIEDLQRMGFTIDVTDELIYRNLFNVGKCLRYLEFIELSEEDELNLATAGAYGIAKAREEEKKATSQTQSTGCLAFILIAIASIACVSLV